LLDKGARRAYVLSIGKRENTGMKVSCGSWIVVSVATGEAVVELFDARTLQHINRDKYRVMCAHQYLTELHRKVNAANA
jgi:hypothetical protein